MPASAIGLKAVPVALLEVGVKENPAGSNWSPRIKQYLAAAGLNYPTPPGAPWCAAFVTWVLKKIGYKVTVPGPASVESWEEWAKRNGKLVARPFRGDVICYDWDSNNWYDHIGFVVRVLALRWRGKVFAGYVKTVEGNTSYGNDSNGGKVMIRYRWINSARFVRL